MKAKEGILLLGLGEVGHLPSGCWISRMRIKTILDKSCSDAMADYFAKELWRQSV
jgi:hypothetical protein